MENLDQLHYRPPRCGSGWQAAHLASRRHHSLAKARPCPRTSSAEKKAPSRAGATSVLITAHLGSRLPTIRRSGAVGVGGLQRPRLRGRRQSTRSQSLLGRRQPVWVLASCRLAGGGWCGCGLLWCRAAKLCLPRARTRPRPLLTRPSPVAPCEARRRPQAPHPPTSYTRTNFGGRHRMAGQPDIYK